MSPGGRRRRHRGGTTRRTKAMSQVIADITMSLDGYVTGPDPDLEHGLGIGGEALHTWCVESDHEVDARVLRSSTEGTGAVVMGRRLFDIIDGPHGWSDEMGYGAAHNAMPPVFVVTHEAPATWRLGDRFRFVTGGLAAAVEAARAAAGDLDVIVMGGGEVVRRAVADGLADELVIHLAPELLGAGTPLFGADPPRHLTQVGVDVSPTATHLRYRVGPPAGPA
jgi:dihydrofolate reductase